MSFAQDLQYPRLHFPFISYTVSYNVPSTWQKDPASTKGHLLQMES